MRPRSNINIVKSENVDPSSAVSDTESTRSREIYEDICDRSVSPTLSEDAPVKKKKKRVAALLTEDDEADLADWLKDNPCLYSKGLKDYRNTDKKSWLWHSKAMELDLDSAMILKTWYESMRTRLGKLTLKKAATGGTGLTMRDQFILEKFEFLNQHIARVPSRQGVHAKARVASSALASEHTPDSGSEFDESYVTLPSTSQAWSAFPQPVITTRSMQKSKYSPVDPDWEAEQPTLNKTGDPASSRAAWAMWIGAMSTSIHDQLLPRFYKQSFDLVMGLVQESSQLRATESRTLRDRQCQQQQQQRQSPGSPQRQFSQPHQQNSWTRP